MQAATIDIMNAIHTSRTNSSPVVSGLETTAPSRESTSRAANERRTPIDTWAQRAMQANGFGDAGM